MEMFDPPHPGEILREDVIPGLETNIAEFARHLCITRWKLSRILLGRAPVSPDLAVRLERAGISTARLWLGIQTDYDLWEAEHREQPSIERYVRLNG